MPQTLRGFLLRSRQFLKANNWFKENRYSYERLKQLGALGNVSSPPITADQAEAVTKRFTQFQGDIQNGRYPSAWEFVSEHLRSIQYQNDFNKFKEQLLNESFKTWCLSLQPTSVTRTEEYLTLNTRQGWRFHCIQEDGQWKLFIGQEPDRSDWQQQMVSTLPKHSTQHFDIY